MNLQAAGTGVILLGGVHGALAAARSLGRKNIPVVYVTDDHALPKSSRYVRASYGWPGAYAPDAVRWLLALAAEHHLQGWLLIPSAEAEVRLIAENRDALRSVFRLISLDWNVLKSVCDKNLLADLAVQIGIPFPRDYHVSSSADVATVNVTFPVLLKPARQEIRSRFSRDKVWRAETRDELSVLYQQAVASVGQSDVVVQEYIPGGGGTQFSYAALWAAGEPVVEMTVRRVRQQPFDFGVSCFIEVVDEPRIAPVAQKLLRAIGYEGLVEIDFKFDARDGQFKPLDVNARIWAWIGLGEAAGVDFVGMFYRLAGGEKPAPAKAADGYRWMHFARDILAAIPLMFRGKLPVPDYLASYKKPLAWATFAWDDPMPVVVEIPVTVSRILRRRLAQWFSRGQAPKPGSGYVRPL